MATNAIWKGVGTRLLYRSKRWQKISDSDRVLWLHLLLASDNHGTVEGDLTVVWATCTARAGWNRDKTKKSLNSLAKAGLIDHYEADGTWWTQIKKYDENQPTESLRRRKAKTTPNPPRKVSKPMISREFRDTSGNVPDTSRQIPPIDKDVDKDVDIDNCLFPNGNKLSEKIPTADLRSQTNEVFEHWKTTEAATGGLTRAALTANRRAKIAARLADGYTVEQLQQCIEGFCYDPFHSGQNNRNTRYTDLTTIFRNAEKVDAGIQKYAQTKKQRNERARLEELYGKPDVVAEYDDNGNFI